MLSFRRPHMHTHTYISLINIRPLTDECETCQILWVNQRILVKKTY